MITEGWEGERGSVGAAENILNKPLNMAVRDFKSGWALNRLRTGKLLTRATRLNSYVHITDAGAAADAAELIERFGGFAADEAGARASRSRDLGNVIHYCRWRQIQRLIEFLETGPSAATVH